jgi:hypothetical protein
MRAPLGLDVAGLGGCSVGRGLVHFARLHGYVDQFGFAFVVPIKSPFFQHLDGKPEIGQAELVKPMKRKVGFGFETQDELRQNFGRGVFWIGKNESSGFFHGTHVDLQVS